MGVGELEDYFQPRTDDHTVIDFPGQRRMPQPLDIGRELEAVRDLEAVETFCELLTW